MGRGGPGGEPASRHSATTNECSPEPITLPARREAIVGLVIGKASILHQFLLGQIVLRSGSGKDSAEEVLMVALHALDRRIDDLKSNCAEFSRAGRNLLDGLTAGLGIANNTTFGNVLAADLKLRLDENDGSTLPLLVCRAQCADHRRQDKCRGNKRDVHR